MIPTISWAQTSEYILLKIMINKVTNLNINFNNNMLCIKGSSSNITYNFNEKLYKDIDLEMSTHTYKVYDSHIDCKLKKNSDEEWDFLIIDHIKHRTHIKIDWLRWGVDDDDDTVNPTDDFQNLIKNMEIKPDGLEEPCLNKNGLEQYCSDNNCSDNNCSDNNCSDNANIIQSGESSPCTSDEEMLE